jgi:hypothetical protein
MAKRRTTPIRVGIAGSDYRDWRGVVYPAPRPAGFDPLRYRRLHARPRTQLLELVPQRCGA